MAKDFLFYTLLLTLLSLTPEAYARREVLRPERANLVSRATGGSGTSSNFEARYNAKFNTSSPNAADRGSANRDTQIEQSRIASLDTSLQTTLITTGPIEGETNRRKKYEEEVDPSGRQDKRVDNITDASEEFLAHRKDKSWENYFEEQAQQRAEELRLQAEEDAEEEEEETDDTQSLKKNPFYFEPTTSKELEVTRDEIIERLVATGKLDLEEAREMVNSAGSTEDIVLELMDTDDFSYGTALKLTTVE